jgi:hypothetical protein
MNRVLKGAEKPVAFKGRTFSRAVSAEKSTWAPQVAGKLISIEIVESLVTRHDFSRAENAIKSM